MRRSCKDSYYVQLVYEYLLHMDLLDTASALRDECCLMSYPVPSEINIENSVTLRAPDIVRLLPTTFNIQKDSEPNIKEVKSGSHHFCCYIQSEGSEEIPPDHSDCERDDETDTNSENLVTNRELSSESSQNEAVVDCESSLGQPFYCNKDLFVRRQNQKISASPHQRNGNDASGRSEQQVEERSVSYTQLKKKFSRLHSDYHNLIGVASELTGALEKSARGQEIDLRETLNNCVQIFPDLFSQNQQETKFKNEAVKGRFSVRSTNCNWNLNIPHVKKHLVEGSVKNRLFLLQALRWVITKSSSQKRECVMNQIVSQDLLELQGESLLKSLLTPVGVVTPHPLQQSAARLLNTLASVQSGRSYLAQNSKTVNMAAAVLHQLDGISSDSITKNMLVAALQKLSLRRYQRIAMIEAGMVEWLLQQLSNLQAESSYSVEYGTALLMNLCLHQSAKELCISMDKNVFTILISLLSTPVTQALPYINGTIFSLISNPQLNVMAAEAGLAKALEVNVMKQNNEELKKQMDHILRYHQALLRSKNINIPSSPSSEGEMIDEDDEELDLLGEELDENDPVRKINGELNGEDLLQAHYTLLSQSDECSGVSESDADESHPSSFRLRPTTPHLSNQNISSYGRTGSQSRRDQETGKMSDLNGKNNWYNKGVSDNSHYNPRRQSLLSESAVSKIETSPSTLGPENETSSNAFLRLLSNGEPTINGSEKSSEKKAFVCYGDGNLILPKISIHLVAKDGNTCTESDNDADEDSEDVQVATMAIQESESQQLCTQLLSNSESTLPETEDTQNTENGDTSAFTSRPKIPRTPPHHS